MLYQQRSIQETPYGTVTISKSIIQFNNRQPAYQAVINSGASYGAATVSNPIVQLSIENMNYIATELCVSIHIWQLSIQQPHAKQPQSANPLSTPIIDVLDDICKRKCACPTYLSEPQRGFSNYMIMASILFPGCRLPSSLRNKAQRYSSG
jgi:hypothetical protein